jgi:hypothetical protein
MSTGTILILVGPEYEDLEVWYPKLRLEEAGYETKLAGIGESVYRGKHGYPCPVDGHVRDFPADALVGLLAPGGWAPDKLRRDPDVLARVRDGDPAYLDAVIKETLRIRPVVMEVGRDLTEDTRIGEWRLPAGTRVMSSIALVQKAEEHWPDPAAFNPERFLNGTGPAPYTWIPFGGGPRRCIGASFATTEMAAIIPVVLGHFDLAPDRPEPERSQTRNVTQVPARGASVILTRRAPKLPTQKEAVKTSTTA